MKKYLTSAVVAAALFGVNAASAAPLLDLTDFAIPIDADPPVIPISEYPLLEGPFNAFDGDVTTKYLNFGERNSGVIFTPAFGSTVAKSLVLTTANDAVARDPASFMLWGTNDAISTPDNTVGPNLENWTLISQGPVALPAARQTAGAPINFGANTTGYTSYRITFPTVKDFVAANSMQISEIGLFDALDGGGNNVALAPIDARAILLEALPNFQSSSPAAEGVSNAFDGTGPRLDLPSQSTYPAAEGPANVVDGTLAKYFNGGGNDAGFIVTPAIGSSTVRSFQITTANDAIDRDPTSWKLYGTNDAITSPDNSYGFNENWTLIDMGAISLPVERDTLGPVVSVNNNTSYTSYKMEFPTRVGPGGGFQIAEMSFFPNADGTGADILNPGDPIRAIDSTVRTGLNTKYLNFGENNSGFIITPGGSTVATSFQVTTANDAPARDPASYEIYGTNDPITSAAHSQGDAENWTLITSGSLALPEERFTAGDLITFTNATAYTSYKVVFPTVKDEVAANSMQIAGFQLFDASTPADADFDNDGDVDGADFLVWQRNVGTAGGNNVGDADGNGQINGLDLAAWRAAFGPGAAAAVGAVPEPSTVLLGGVAAGLAAAVCRRTGKRE